MRSVSEHLEHLLTLVSPTEVEAVALAGAVGRVLRGDVVAVADAPPWDNSAMDGYAVASADGSAGSWRVSQDIPAGHVPLPLEPGTVARIMTGAPMPQGADAVVPVERTDAGTERVRIRDWPVVGAHVRPAGADMREGGVVLAAPRRLRAVDVAAAAAAGRAEVAVARRPRVAVLVTGDELVAPGEPLGPAAIYDSNSALLRAGVQEWGGAVTSVEVVGDGPQALLEALAGLDADLVLTAAGVSAGAYDVVKEALVPRGVQFAPVAMQPGKPQGWGRIDGVPIVCAPGNPVSVAVTFRLFVVPMLCAMLGVPAPTTRPLRVAQGWRTPDGRAQLMPVSIEGDTVRPATSGGSGSNLAGALARADGFAYVAADVVQVEPGATVDVMGLVP
ncbi:molybdopterin molybdotransferase MoeA [Demequina capsici]|uniref:Molybdopterin molybdenumtransferase n=1 Tax=Demequina capsici TaxID=3075620 RepID=A0AA96FDJ3_9MICO|nr:gephyrin-like molybdotransferase Glp [Demequina sp. PMTSA13]WNM28329.1 molybdopterin molybdotransferase MoeA [Demequina sp. PMTSA13]